MTSPCASSISGPLWLSFSSAELHWFRRTSVWSDTSAEPLQTPTPSVKREQSRTGGKCCGSPAPGPAERLRLIDKQRKEDTADKRHSHVSLKNMFNCLELLVIARDCWAAIYRSIGCASFQEIRTHLMQMLFRLKSNLISMHGCHQSCVRLRLWSWQILCCAKQTICKLNALSPHEIMMMSSLRCRTFTYFIPSTSTCRVWEWATVCSFEFNGVSNWLLWWEPIGIYQIGFHANPNTCWSESSRDTSTFADWIFRLIWL